MVASTVEFDAQFSDGEVELIRKIVSAIKGLRYGSVTIIVHDGRIMEFQRSEKFRIENPQPKPT
jgi:hypothetical protein